MSSKARRMSAGDRAEVERLYYEGLKLVEIAEAVGFTDSAVCAYLQRNDLHRPAKTAVTEKMVDRIARWYERGYRPGVIGDRLGVHPGVVYRHLERRGVERRIKPVSEEERARMAELYQAGETILSIARATRRTRGAVRQALRRAGVYDSELQEARRGKASRPAAHPWKAEYFGVF